MMKIFLTGCTGFIGSRFLESFSHDPTVMFYCLIPKGRKTGRVDNVAYIEADFKNATVYADALKDADYVVHLAAELDSKNPEIEKVNVEFTKILVEGCQGSRLSKFIFFSSITVKRKNLVGYSRTKKMAEDVVKNAGVPYLIIRPVWVVGRGSRSVDNFENYLKRFPIVPVIGSGRTKMQPVHIDDLIAIVKKMIFAEDEVGTTIEIGGGEVCAYNDFIDVFLQVLGSKKKKVHLPMFLCKILSRTTNILSPDAVSDFEYDTVVDNKYLVQKYGYDPDGVEKIIKKIVT